MRALLSIKPIYVDRILDGSKRFEFRRRIFGRTDVTRVVIYSTSPVSKIVAEFDIQKIIQSDPARLWELTFEFSGINRSAFDEYFDGRTQAFALQIGQVHRLPEPIAPSELISNFTPPQSYMYMEKYGEANRQLDRLFGH